MRSSFTGIEMAKRSLFTQQAALQTTGHNIANANTKGYTRQVVNMIAARPLEAVGMMRSTVPGQIGQSVEFDHIERIREGFLDKQFYYENKSLGEWTTRMDTLEKLEAIMNEPSDTGIRKVIEDFWNGWQDVSKEPENVTARAALKEKAIALTDALNHTSSQLNDLSTNLTDNIEVKVDEVNTILTQVANLNNEIFRVEGLGNDANDLRDQRDLLVDNLSEIVNITMSETNSGYNINMGNTQLVNGITVTSTLSSQSIEGSISSGDLSGGQIYGLVVSRDQYLTSYKFQFDSMVKSLVEGNVDVTMPSGTVLPEGTIVEGITYTGSVADRTLTSDKLITVKGINGLHQLGYTLEDPPKSGIPFFTLKAGATEFNAGSITVNPEILKKVSQIAASSRLYTDSAGAEKVIKGNNDIALNLAAFRTQKFDFDENANGIPLLSNGTISEFFHAIVGQLGVQTQEAIRQNTNQQILVNQVDSRRQSISGVSLDEEMANMIKFQHAYNAAARSLTTFDEMLDKVINGMGVVGR